MLSERWPGESTLVSVWPHFPNTTFAFASSDFIYEHWLGNREQAVQQLGRAIESGYPWKEVEGSPALAALRSDSRFEQLRQRAPRTGARP